MLLNSSYVNGCLLFCQIYDADQQINNFFIFNTNQIPDEIEFLYGNFQNCFKV